VTTHLILVIYIIVARLAELNISHIHTRRLVAMGGYEVGGSHYPIIVLVHLSWVIAIVFLIPTDTPGSSYFLLPFLCVQVCRYWVISSLGKRWTTRIIVMPEVPLVKHGPYRWLRHPNYVVVAAEIALLPLVFGAWEIALGFSIANAAILIHRIRVEETALSMHKFG
jgi:methyltransferase